MPKHQPPQLRMRMLKLFFAYRGWPVRVLTFSGNFFPATARSAVNPSSAASGAS